MSTQKDTGKKKKGVVGFQVVEDECIWMKAGVVNFRTCDNAYDCFNCPFDKGMRNAMKSDTPTDAINQVPGWVHHLKQKYHGTSRPCRHALTGHIDAPKICAMNYECYHCPYDQMMDEIDLAGMSSRPNYETVSGFKMAQGYYYHTGHSWARFDHGGRVRIGFDDFLVKLFGEIEELNLPPLGSDLKQDQVGWEFGRDSRKAAVLSPVTGKVLAVNKSIEEHPAIASQDPYQEGWLFILEPNMPKRNLKGLFFEDEGFHWMEQESQKLLGLVGQDYQQLAATGGEVIHDIYGQVPNLSWKQLVNTFLRTEEI
jgi:glycine cleavage system H lipoate-binding protein